jgi:hypothetical protein
LCVVRTYGELENDKYLVFKPSFAAFTDPIV